MADDKADVGSNHGREVTLFLIGLALLSMFLWRIEQILAQSGTDFAGVWATILAYLSYYIWPVVKIAATIVSLALIIGIAYNLMKLKEINLEEREVYGATNVASALGKGPEVKNEKWERVIEHINSPNSSDWRLAIIEADVMLDELLRASGYDGNTIGDMLKAVEPSDMLTLDNAWEAHKTRNRIAHQAGDFHLNEREAKHTIALYELVFKEFEMI